MNKYLIHYKISTVAELINPFEFGGYKFTSHCKNWWECDAWVASAIIEETNAGKARGKFIKGLIPQIEKCSVVSQCAFRLIANSYFIYKLTNNSEKIVYIYYAKEVSHTGLHFDEEEILALEICDKIPESMGPFFLQEAANATTFFSRLQMLLAAVEAFAGEEKSSKVKRTDKENIIKILGKELYEKLYTYGTGLRHKLMHGSVRREDMFDGLTEEVYNKIRTYLKSEYGLVLNEEVVHPQRNFYGNHIFTATSEIIRDLNSLNLELIEQAFDTDNPDHHKVSADLFEGYSKLPENY